jgi:hypothetical protein
LKARISILDIRSVVPTQLATNGNTFKTSRKIIAARKEAEPNHGWAPDNDQGLSLGRTNARGAILGVHGKSRRPPWR